MKRFSRKEGCRTSPDEKGLGVVPAIIVVAEDVESRGLHGEREQSTGACVLGVHRDPGGVCVSTVCVCGFVSVFTRAYSIFRVQQPAYMSAPLSADFAFWAFLTVSNVATPLRKSN